MSGQSKLTESAVRREMAPIAFLRLKIMILSMLLMGVVLKTSADARINFRLNAPTTYFENVQSIALLQAALANDEHKAKALVAAGANPNDEGPRHDLNASRLRLLHYAIASENMQAVRILVAVGADPELDAQHNGPAFLFTLTLNNVDMLGMLLDMRPVKLLSPQTLKELLFESIVQRRSQCLTLLLDRGAPIDLRVGAKETISMSAMSSQNFELAEQLILRGASVSIDTPSGVTPAYQVQRMLTLYLPGSTSYLTLQRIKNLMIGRGAVFPATDPKELRERRKANGAGQQP